MKQSQPQRQRLAAHRGLPPQARAQGAAPRRRSAVRARRSCGHAPARARPSRQPLQPATSKATGRCPVACRADHEARRGGQPLQGARRGSRSAAVTQSTAPARGARAAAGGAGPASTSARRTCTDGHAPMSCPTSTGRRSPGSRIAQPLARARWTQSEPAARTAMSSASGLAGDRAVQHHQRGGVELRHEPALDHLAAPGHGRPVDARRRRPLAVGAQAVDLELGRGGVETPARRARARRRFPCPVAGPRAPAARRGHRLDARQHEHLALALADHHALAHPRAGRGSRAARARARGGRAAQKRTLIRTRRDQRPAIDTGQPSSGSSSSPPGGGSRPVRSSTRSG